MAHSTDLYTIWAWYERNKKPVNWGAAILVSLALVVWFFIWQRDQKEAAAAEALSKVSAQLFGRPAPHPGAAEAYLKIAADYSGSSAGARALLLAAGTLFADGRYDEAKAQFQRFTRDYRESPFLPQALLGLASCLDAQGKSADAITAYKDLVDHHPGETVVGQAKFALAQLYAAQNKPELAYSLYEEVKRSDPFGALGDEALFRGRELETKYPNLAPKPAVQPAPAPLLQTK